MWVFFIASSHENESILSQLSITEVLAHVPSTFIIRLKDTTFNFLDIIVQAKITFIYVSFALNAS